jgi:hypothetical protein
VNEKIDNIITYFDNLEKDEKVGISVEGYEKLLFDLNLRIENIQAAYYKRI